MYNEKDSNSTYFIRELSKVAHNGGGFVRWKYPKPNTTKPSPKLGYAQVIQGTDWWMGAGIYVDDIEADKAKAANEIDDMLAVYLWAGAGITIGYIIFIIIPGVFTLSNLIVNPLKLLQKVARDAELGDFIEDVDAPPPAETVAQKMLTEELGEILDQLTPREARILRLRYGLQDGESRTLKEVGEMFGLSRERIRQLEKEALRKLRHPNFAGHLRQYLN